VHYPSDVIGGAVVGVICAWIILIIEKRVCLFIEKRKWKLTGYKGSEMTR
jgi:membrane-associated phospholipid phosphatase